MTGNFPPTSSNEGRDETASAEPVGDAACWAHLLCSQCGRVLDPADRAAAPNSDDDEALCASCRAER